LDLLGVAIAAAREPAVIAALGYAKKFGGAGLSTIYGGNGKFFPAQAALVNGIMGHCYDYDDFHRGMVAHPGVVIVPTALAVSESEGLDGKRFLAAVILGYEIAIRSAMAGKAGVAHEKGFHPTGTAGVFGATVAAGKILGLDEVKMANALGIAGSQASGLFEFQADGSWTKRFNAGWASHNGIVAALLAKEGFTGPHSVFEGVQGYLSAYLGKGNYDEKVLVQALGSEFEILDTEFKLYPCCGYNATPIDGTLELVQEYNIVPDEIEEIEARVFKELLNTCAEPRNRKIKPASRVDAQFSIYFSIASAIVRGKPSLDDFSDKSVRDKQVLDLASKVRVIVDPEIQSYYPRFYASGVCIKTKSRGTFKTLKKSSKGSPELVEFQDIQEKFRKNCSKAYDEETMNKILQTVNSLEKSKRISELTSLL
jgi:2-methylcitrate dehydratase PrpD